MRNQELWSGREGGQDDESTSKCKHLYIHLHTHTHVQSTHMYNVKDGDVTGAAGEMDRKQERMEDFLGRAKYSMFAPPTVCEEMSLLLSLPLY